MDAGFDIPGYVDVEQIGAGGFGRVFRARQPAFDRTVAVKILNGRLDDAATVRRFQRECQALGSVSSHPNIVPVYDAGGTPDGVPYLVMDYVRGGSLADRLARTGPLPWPDVAVIGVKLAGALHSAHAAGVLHRDIKPENILVSGYGEPQLADFGIAQRAGIENRTTTAAAMTPSHTAPEQFSGSPPSERTDIYALASTLFTLLAGASPFQGRPEESIFALISRASSEPPPDLRRRGVPDALARVVEAGLAKDPAARPASAVDYGRMLQEAQQALNVAVTPLPVAQDDGAPSFVPTGFATLPPGGTGGTGPGGHAPEVTPATFQTRPHYAPPPGSTDPLPPGPPAYGYPPVPPPPPGYGPPPLPYGVPMPGHTTDPGSPSGHPPQQPGGGRGRLMVAAVVAVLLVVAGVGVAIALNHRTSATDAGRSTTTPGTSVTPAGPATGSTPGSTPEQTPDQPSPTPTVSASDSPTDTGGGQSSGGGDLDSKLLKAGQAPLADWTAGGGLLAGYQPPDGTDYFCNKTIDVSGAPHASTMVSDASGTHILDEHVYRLGGSRAKKTVAQVRASASCGSWQSPAGQLKVTRGDDVSAGDEAVAYLTTASVPLETYQIFFRTGGDYGVITLVTIGATTSAADRDLAGRAAAEAARRLGG